MGMHYRMGEGREGVGKCCCELAELQACTHGALLCCSCIAWRCWCAVVLDPFVWGPIRKRLVGNNGLGCAYIRIDTCIFTLLGTFAFGVSISPVTPSFPFPPFLSSFIEIMNFILRYVEYPQSHIPSDQKLLVKSKPINSPSTAARTAYTVMRVLVGVAWLLSLSMCVCVYLLGFKVEIIGIDRVDGKSRKRRV